MPRQPPTSTLFPYTTLFRSSLVDGVREPAVPPRIRRARFLGTLDRKSTRLNSSHVASSYAGFCLKKKSDTRWCQQRPAEQLTKTRASRYPRRVAAVLSAERS